MTTNQNQCPCCSGSTYEECCKPYHEGALPKNAEILMRSRYSAYALNLTDYIIDTTHPASPQYSDNKFAWKRRISGFSKASIFQKLEVLDFKEKDTVAIVIFTAHILQDGQDASFTEKSYFEKIDGRWAYRNGQLADKQTPITKEELSLLPLAYYDAPVLRQKAVPLSEITEDIKKLAQEMTETMDANNGIGLAAPQVNHSIRLFLIREPIEKEDNKFEAGVVKVFINPTLSSPSQETWEADEGCLSIPTIRASVKRPKEITVEYTDLDGTRSTKRFSGWAARIIMHENDHLNGVLFIDRLSPDEKEKLKPILHNLNARIHPT